MENNFIHIKRHYGNDNHTIGICTVFQTELTNDLITTYAFNNGMLGTDLLPKFSACSLERGWVDNEPNVSCVPLGEYHLVYEHSPRFDRKLWELKDVPNRTECKFHASNYFYQLNGCIALGSRVTDMDSDGNYDVTNSGRTMEIFDMALQEMRGKIVKLIVE